MRLTRQNFSGVILVLALLAGCASIKISEKETPQEAVSALGAVAGSISQQDMDEEKMREVAKKLQSDEEAQTAVEAISESLEGKNINIKYSPATGKRYSGDLEYDPETGVKLIPLEP